MKKYIIIGLLVIILGCLFYIWHIYSYKNPAKKDFIVKQGEGTREIARNLKDENIISSSWVFSFYVYRRNWYLQPGVYYLDSGLKLTDIARVLHEGKVSEYSITIPEGWRLTQIDEYLAEKEIIEKGDLIKISSSDEGYLFPDTYRLSLDANAESIRNLLISNFNKKTKNLNVSADIITIASIVEREAKFDEDRAKIAGVYFNRIEKEMKLEADPTIQYAKGSWDPITRADYRNVQSPYNTYLNEGLPPSPICNPGIKSIEAVLNPEKNGWLYFFHKDDGHAIYSATIEEHEENLKKYR